RPQVYIYEGAPDVTGAPLNESNRLDVVGIVKEAQQSGNEDLADVFDFTEATALTVETRRGKLLDSFMTWIVERARLANRTYAVFFSYAKVDTVAEVAVLFDAAAQEFGEDRVFVDVEQRFKLTELIHRVRDSQNVIVLLSPNYPKRPFALIELYHALRSGVN